MRPRDIYKAYVGNVYSGMRQGSKVPVGTFVLANLLNSAAFSLLLARILFF